MSELSRRQFLGTMVGGLAVGPLTPELHTLWRNAGASQSRRRREEYLAILRRLLPATNPDSGRLNAYDRTWEAWLERTGELPPDFALMPGDPHLTHPLKPIVDGAEIQISTPAEWEHERERLKAAFQRWIFGRMPPGPDNLRGTVTERSYDGDVRIEDVRLEFGPGREGRLHLQLLLPPGPGPFPVFLTNHWRRRPWVNTAVRRGYAGCIYYAVDSYYRTVDDSDAWIELYPEHDFGLLARWAWGAMRAVDYLHTLPYVRKDQIAITGHSRNSKQALLAAAFDERIKAVAPSRGNTGDQMPWRFTSDLYASESLEDITGGLPAWFHPRLRFFVGREHKLPVDQHQLLALVAPRALLLSHAFNEHQGNAVGIENSYRQVQTVYRFLGAEENLALYQQPGEHEASVEDVERYVDFFDTVFGRKAYPRPEIWVHGFTYERWLRQSGETIDPGDWPRRAPGDRISGVASRETGSHAAWAKARDEVRERIRWLLGEEPPGVTLPLTGEARVDRTMVNNGWQGQLLGRPVPLGDVVRARRLRYGDQLRGQVYFPVDPAVEAAREPTDRRWRPLEGSRFPVVVWLHPYSYAMGYTARNWWWSMLVYGGFAVAVFDQIGFGVRNLQALRFYERYPRWSLLGKMVTDTRAALDAIFAEDWVDPERVLFAGYALGGKIALYTAAMDDRIKGVSAACAFSPLRLTSASDESEGVRHYSHIHGLLPRLGAFIGRESRIPVDYDEILAAVAPRPVQILAPKLDRYNPVEHTRTAVEEARKIFGLWGREHLLELETPEDFHRYANLWQVQQRWLFQQAGLAEPGQG